MKGTIASFDAFDIFISINVLKVTPKITPNFSYIKMHPMSFNEFNNFINA